MTKFATRVQCFKICLTFIGPTTKKIKYNTLSFGWVTKLQNSNFVK